METVFCVCRQNGPCGSETVFGAPTQKVAIQRGKRVWRIHIKNEYMVWKRCYVSAYKNGDRGRKRSFTYAHKTFHTRPRGVFYMRMKKHTFPLLITKLYISLFLSYIALFLYPLLITLLYTCSLPIYTSFTVSSFTCRQLHNKYDDSVISYFYL